MSGFTPQIGDVFVSNSSQVIAAQAVQYNPDGSLTIPDAINGATDIINSITIEAATPNQTAVVSYGTISETVITTTYNVHVDNFFASGSATMYLLGTDGAHALVYFPIVPYNNVVLSPTAVNFGTINDTFTPVFTVVACFAAGTRILTPAGEVPVEALHEGDPVVSAFGRSVPVQWLGHRHIDCRRQPRPQDVWPVRVCASAFGPNLPHRDLLLSPDHAVFLPAAQVLIPIRYLINGATIVQEPVDAVTYWHVELAVHDVLLAEGLPAESYLDTGNRGAFANGGGVTAAHPDFARQAWQASGRAPLVVGGPVLARQQARLLARAAALGHARTDDPDLCVVAGGNVLRPRSDGATLVLDLPPGTHEVTLRSRSTVPAWTTPGKTDHRRLGVAVQQIRLNGCEVPETNRRAGWHAMEDGLQWTDGEAVLAVGPGRLAVTLAMTARYWTAEPGGLPARHLAQATGRSRNVPVPKT